MNIKQEIQTTYQDLLTKNNKITVTNLCNHLNISRKTFYKYFANIDDITVNIIQDTIFIPLSEFSTVDQFKDEDTLTILTMMYLKIYQKQDFFKNIYTKNYTLLHQTLYQKNKELNEHIFKDHLNPDYPKDYIIDLAALGGCQLIEKWISQDFDLEPRQMAELFYYFVNKNWLNLLIR